MLYLRRQTPGGEDVIVKKRKLPSSLKLWGWPEGLGVSNFRSFLDMDKEKFKR